MKIGQVVKNTLNELSKQSWSKIDDDLTEFIEITVEPQFSHAVEILMHEGLDNLKHKYKNISIYREDNIYIRVESFSGEHQAKNFLQTFFQDLEAAICSYVKELSQSWIISSLSIDEITIPKEYIKEYGSEMIIMEHAFSAYSGVLLRILAKQYNYYPEVLDITHHTRKKIEPIKDYIIGKKDFVTRFINLILGDLSPSYYTIQSTEINEDKVTLKNLCIKVISRYSIFYPEIFSIDNLSKYDLPEDILSQIEETPMVHILKGEDIVQYNGKIVVFKTPSRFLSTEDDYLIYPERKELKVGFINNKCFFESKEQTFNFCGLSKIASVSCSRFLATSTIKYSNFKIRLPLPSELDKIKDVVLNQKAKFEFLWGVDILSIIDSQKKGIEDIISVEMAKLSV